ncbi:hypothetical protein [Psychroflexus sp. ALD_RP9]|uniref:hypothetical protein n=1 Tax=Psychroflexus sp. ALD_RP9 TaxID=2777186 RepID=UPI001A8D9E35|nr:hypothetical protein [Psychroflexus sp. ALD_RP9]QSS96565.1 hypothetical protein IMZ30_08935 [Psychroflexus sp. ALD_RP9]
MKDNPKLKYSDLKRLYQFTREHFVVYVDVQRIFVKELAEGIKKQWEQNPDLKFETALERQFKTYGIYGFSDRNDTIVQKLQNYYLKISIKYSLEKLLSKNILLNLILACLVYYMFFSLGWQAYYLLTFAILFIVGAFILQFRHQRKLNKSRKSHTASLINETIKTGGNSGTIMLIFVQFPLQISKANTGALFDEMFLVSMYLIMILGVYILYTSYYIIPENNFKIKRLLHQKLQKYQTV